MNQDPTRAEKYNEFLFAYLIEDRLSYNPSDKVSWQKIPLHLPLSPWLKTEETTETILDIAATKLSNLSPVTTMTTLEDNFGVNGQFRAMRIKKTPELLNLHSCLLELAKTVKADYNPQYAGQHNWDPHVANKGYRRLNSFQDLEIQRVDLVQRLSYKQKALVGRIALTGYDCRQALTCLPKQHEDTETIG